MTQPRALVLSPFATIPDDAGQRRRVRQTTTLLKEMGYAITFVLYAFEEGWMTSANEAHLEAMRRDWGEVIVLRANPKVGSVAAFGPDHWLDEWWDDHIESLLKEMFRFRYFDVFVVHNVWLSKAFEFSPRSTVRILDAHDVFSMRRAYFEKLGIKPEFYLPQEGAERDGVNRSDFVLGIQEQDASWFAQHTDAESICLPYCCPAPSPGPGTVDYLHTDKVVFGFLGSAHIFNIHGLTAFCRELKDLVGRTAAPVELRVAGNVGQYLETRGPWTVEGYVKNEAAFLSGVDIIVVPVFDGSGFKVKVADAIAFGKPTIASTHAAIGLKLDDSVLAETPLELARMAVQIALERPKLADLQDMSLKSNAELGLRCAAASKRLLRRIRTTVTDRTLVYDLSSLSLEESHCVLLSWLGGFHVLRSAVRQIVVLPGEIDPEISDLALPGVTFVPESTVHDPTWRMRHWITVANRKPIELGVQERNIFVDEVWAVALGYLAPNPRGFAPGIFWHSIAWDLMCRRIANHAVRRIPAPERSHETVFVLDGQQSPGLVEQLLDLYGSHFSVLEAENFADFYKLVMQITGDIVQIRRVVVLTPKQPQRLMVLQELCAARGIEYFGPVGKGGLGLGKSSEDLVQAHYARFEQKWRAVLDNRGQLRAVAAVS
jgi:hypothetical protein